MKLNDKQAQELQNLLHIYLQQFQELFEVLKRERESMKARQFDVFDTIIQHKMHLLNETATFDNQLNEMLKKIFKTPNKAPSKDIITKTIDLYEGQFAKTLKLQFSNLKKMAADCRRLNEINSKIVSHAQQHYGRIIAIICKEDPDAKTYSKTGRTKLNKPSGGRLAQA